MEGDGFGLGTDLSGGLMNDPNWLRYQQMLGMTPVDPLPATPTKPVQQGPPLLSPDELQAQLTAQNQQLAKQIPQPWQGQSPRVQQPSASPEEDFGRQLGKLASQAPPQTKARVLDFVTGAVGKAVDAIGPAIPPELRAKGQGVLQAATMIDPVQAGFRAGPNLKEGKVADAALDMLGMIPGEGILAGAAKVAPAMFLGVGAKGANLEKLAIAKKMQAEGASPADIWKTAGWNQDKGGQWFWEVPDTNARYTPQPEGSTGHVASSFLQHPELYAADPSLANIRTHQYTPGAQPPGTGGYLAPPPPGAKGVTFPERIRFSPDARPGTVDEPRTVLLHELQHAAQQRYGFDPGSSPTDFSPGSAPRQVYDEVVADAQKPKTYEQFIKDEGLPHGGRARAEYQNFLNAQKNLPDYFLQQVKDHAGPEGYQRSAGEVAARNVSEVRANMFPDELRRMPPQSTADVPWDQQILTKKPPPGGAASAGDVAQEMALSIPKGPGTVTQPRPMTPEELKKGLWSHTETGPKRDPILPGDTRVSTRFPTAKGSTENPLREHLSIGDAEMKMNQPDKQGRGGYHHNIRLLGDYPGFERLKNMDDMTAVQEYLKQAQGNMQYLFDRSPPVMKERSPLWYQGAHELADALANRWQVPRRSASGALASLSPQMDWFKNGSLGERVGDIMTSAAAGKRMTPEMLDYARSQMVRNPNPKAPQPFLVGDTNRELMRRIEGKTLDELTDPLDKALWIRLYDEAHNPRNYRSITPEGNFGDWIRNQGKDGQPGEMSNVGWGALGEIQKAVRSLESGGNMDIISELLGNKHKVRSFYNNIERPMDARYGDITGDTHQVAAAQMRPLSGKSPAVSHNLASGGSKGSKGVSSSDVTGVQGTYGLTADATRNFARENQMLARAGQSATWEPVRELFPAAWKRNPANVSKVDDIWREFDRGKISIEQARDAIFNFAGGIGTPEWARSGLKTTPPNKGSTYR